MQNKKSWINITTYDFLSFQNKELNISRQYFRLWDGGKYGVSEIEQMVDTLPLLLCDMCEKLKNINIFSVYQVPQLLGRFKVAQNITKYNQALSIPNSALVELFAQLFDLPTWQYIRSINGWVEDKSQKSDFISIPVSINFSITKKTISDGNDFRKLKVDIEKAKSDGYKYLKFTLSPMFEIENNVQVYPSISSVIEAFKEITKSNFEGINLYFDAHCTLTLRESLELAENLYKMRFQAFFEPLNYLSRPEDAQILTSQSKVSIGIGSLTNNENDLLSLLWSGYGHAILPNIGNCGGITEVSRLVSTVSSMQTNGCIPMSSGGVISALQTAHAIVAAYKDGQGSFVVMNESELLDVGNFSYLKINEGQLKLNNKQIGSGCEIIAKLLEQGAKIWIP